jgi:hypothetical protein
MTHKHQQMIDLECLLDEKLLQKKENEQKAQEAQIRALRERERIWKQEEPQRLQAVEKIVEWLNEFEKTEVCKKLLQLTPKVELFHIGQHKIWIHQRMGVCTEDLKINRYFSGLKPLNVIYELHELEQILNEIQNMDSKIRNIINSVQI